VEKTRSYQKTSKWMHGLETGCTVRSITADVQPRAQTYGPECDKKLYFHPLSRSSCFLVLELF
jgi:hypothetical protein